MDFISLLLSLFGLGRDHANRVSDKRLELIKLNAEVATEVGRTLDLLNAAQPRIIRRMEAIHRDQPDLRDQIQTYLDNERATLNKMVQITQNNSVAFLQRSSLANTEAVLHKMIEWRGTASRLHPYMSDILGRLEKGLDDDEQLLNG